MKTFKQYIKESPLPNSIGYEDKATEPLNDLPSFKEKRHILHPLNNGIIKHRHFLNKTYSEYTVHHPSDDSIRMYVSGDQKEGSNKFYEDDLGSAGQSPVKAHELYHHLITKHNLHMHSCDSLSKGGLKVWDKLRDSPDINFQLYNNKTGEYKDLHPNEKLDTYMHDKHVRFSAKKAN